MQHLAWLHTAPDDKDRTSRIESLPENHIYRQMPEVAADYLLEELNRIGIVSSGANGLSAITWQDIAAYQSQNHNLLNSWECECLIECSRAYVRQYNSKDSEPPYVTDDEEALAEHKKEQVRLMKSALRTSAKAP